LLHRCCTKSSASESKAFHFLLFAGLSRVGDAGFEPATSAV
jgi:hypothetical protein